MRLFVHLAEVPFASISQSPRLERPSTQLLARGASATLVRQPSNHSPFIPEEELDIPPSSLIAQQNTQRKRSS
jgi:hypothetical protein